MPNVSAANESLNVLKKHLSGLPFKVHLTMPRNVAFDVQDFPEWSLYDFAFDEYMDIGNADCQLVCNETPDRQGFINKLMAREILCGMYKQKTIILLQIPTFDDDVDEYSKTLINTKLDKIYICDLLHLDAADAENFLRDTCCKTINYGLTNYDLVKIKGLIRSHLRKLQEV